MTPLRLLLVDDSAIARRITIAALTAHPEVEVAAAAPSGSVALARLPELKPDAVILDVEMPGMDGLETLRRIRADHPHLPVIMFSAATERGAMVTIQALSMGASDYVCKPSGLSGTTAESVVSEELVPKLLAVCGRSSAHVQPATAPALHSLRTSGGTAPAPRLPAMAIDAVVIASSTGGPNALARVIPSLPASLGVPVFIVQHMPPIFTRHLAERLDAAGPLRAREAQGNELASAGDVFIAPGDYHLEIHRVDGVVCTRITQGPRENSCRPAADVLFRSAAETYGGRVLGVVLTGMGQDGLEGCRALTRTGAKVLVQNEATCVVWGMPKSVELAGLADAVLPLDSIGSEITRRVEACARTRGVA